MEEKREGYVVQCDINHTDSNGFYLLPQEVSSHEGVLFVSHLIQEPKTMEMNFTFKVSTG